MTLITFSHMEYTFKVNKAVNGWVVYLHSKHTGDARPYVQEKTYVCTTLEEVKSKIALWLDD